MSWLWRQNTRKQKQQALQQLRQQQSPTFSGFTPSKAFVISGHGSEGTGFFRVPKDVVVVAKMQPHKVMLTKMADKLSTKVICKPEIYKDPLAHMDVVIKELGDVAVYREGDLCPNFSYTLVNDNSLLRSSDSISIFNRSGLLDIEEQQCGPVLSTTETEFFFDKDSIHDTEIQQLILDVFEDSIRPKKEALISSFSSSKIQTFREWYVYYRDYLFRTTQEQLAKNPGVYYNFICRYSPKSKENAVNVTSNNIASQNVKSIFPIIQSNPQMKQLMREYLSATTPEESAQKYKEIGKLTRNLTSEYIGLSTTPVGEKYLTKESAYSNFASAPMKNKKKVLLNRIAEAETIRKRAMYYAQHPENVEGHRLAKEANVVRRLEREARLKPLWNRMAEKQSKPKWYQFWKGKTMKQVRPLNMPVEQPKKPWYKFWGGKTRRRRS